MIQSRVRGRRCSASSSVFGHEVVYLMEYVIKCNINSNCRRFSLQDVFACFGNKRHSSEAKKFNIVAADKARLSPSMHGGREEGG